MLTAPTKVMSSLSLSGQSYNTDGLISDKITKSWTETMLKKANSPHEAGQSSKALRLTA